MPESLGTIRGAGRNDQLPSCFAYKFYATLAFASKYFV
jgi:hypothetical protein